MHEEYKTNGMSTVGANINVIKRNIAEKVGAKYPKELPSCIAALRFCVRITEKKVKGKYSVAMLRNR